jgi:hypothetical protein
LSEHSPLNQPALNLGEFCGFTLDKCCHAFFGESIIFFNL